MIHSIYMNNLSEKIITDLFVDNIYLHKYIHCHRLPDRSFFIKNRQFHICARCTGLLVGLIASIFISFFPIREYIAFLFPLFLAVLSTDGLTQKINLRKSNNKLRFLTGITTGFTLLPFFISHLIQIL